MFDFSLEISKKFIEWLKDSISISVGKIAPVCFCYLGLLNLKKDFGEMKHLLDMVWRKQRKVGKILIESIQEKNEESKEDTHSKYDFSEFLKTVDINEYKDRTATENKSQE